MVLVKLNGKDLYLESGAALSLGISSLGGNRIGDSVWIKTGARGYRPSMPESSASCIERKADLKLVAETGGLEGKLTVTYTGIEAHRRRLEQRNADDTERKCWKTKSGNLFRWRLSWT